MKDLKEIEEESVPTVGVYARPLDNDMFTWHCVMRGPPDTPYAGGVYHLELNFTELYPIQPPSVTLLTPITHPNVIGGTICLDMLQTTSKKLYEGWTSAYSIQSILMQLQSFLFKEPSQSQYDQIRKEVDKANEYQYTRKEARGQKQMIPFTASESNPDFFILQKSEQELLKEEMVCFHTKLTIDQKAILGAGISITRLPRTGEIRSVSSAMDILSL